MSPLVSVVIPTQRRPGMLKAAAASVLGQTFQDLELIIVLNAAAPEAIEAAREIAQRPNVRLLFRKGGGISCARNAGLAAAKGEWIAYLDDDDTWLPTKIDEQIRKARSSGADLIACDMVKFDEAGDLGPLSTPIPTGLTLSEALTTYNHLPGGASSALIRTKVVRDLGGFDERMRACEDWDMWRRLSWDHKISRVHKVLARYRVHIGSMSRSRPLMLRAELRHLIKLTFDTPTNLRHAVPGAWKAMFWREAANLFAVTNEFTGGRVHLIYRRFRALARRPDLAHVQKPIPAVAMRHSAEDRRLRGDQSARGVRPPASSVKRRTLGSRERA